jgi:hypothetical protein
MAERDEGIEEEILKDGKRERKIYGRKKIKGVRRKSEGSKEKDEESLREEGER